MFRVQKYLIVIPALLFVLGCQLVSQPLQQAGDLVSTAQSLQTDVGGVSTQISGFATDAGDISTQAAGIATEFLGDSTSEPVGTSGPAAEEWKGIPIMPEATSGQDLGGIYEYHVNAKPEEIANFYSSHLKDDGWSELFSSPYTSGAGLMTFTRGSETLVITYSDNSDGKFLVTLTVS